MAFRSPYITYPSTRRPNLKACVIEDTQLMRIGVDALELHETDDRGITCRTSTVRSVRGGSMSDEEMFKALGDNSAGPEGTLRLEAVTPDIFRLRFALGRPEDDSLPDIRTAMTVDNFEQPVTVKTEQGDGAVILSAGEYSLTVTLDHYEIVVADRAGNTRLRIGGPEQNNFKKWDSQWLGFSGSPGAELSEFVAVDCIDLKRDEGIYGLGEHFMGLNKNGCTIDICQEDSCGTTTPRKYKSVPFYMSTRGYGLFVNQTARMNFWVGTRIVTNVQLAVEDDYLDYFIILGNDLKEILDRYTGLTGKSPVPPKWSFGLWMSKISYRSQDEVMTVARTLREKKIPADVIHLDTHWFETEWVCDLKFDKTRFPDPGGMLTELRKLGFHVSVWQMPYIHDTNDLFEEAVAKGYLLKNPDGVLTPQPKRGVIDYTNPDAVKWHQDKFRELFKLGIAAVKTDFGEAAPDDGIYYDGTPGYRMHNLYPLLYNKAIFEVTQECTGEGLVWGRSATAGNQRYPLYWGGDNSPYYTNIEPSLCGGMSLGLCGFSFWSHDIGGFSGMPDPGLMIRWFQVGIFGSHPRIHGSQDREPYRFGEEAERICREFLELRYRLMPYIYSVAHHSAEQGLPMLRPLVLEFETDRNVRDLSSQFMFGPSLMIAPVLEEGSTQRDVYFPAGVWTEWWTGQTIHVPVGQWLRREIPLDRVGLFVRAGSIIPMAPLSQYVDEHPLDSVDLHVYPGEKDMSFTLVDKEKAEIVYRHATQDIATFGTTCDFNVILHNPEFDS